MTKAKLDSATIRELIRTIDKSPAVTWTGKGGVKERLQAILHELDSTD